MIRLADAVSGASSGSGVAAAIRRATAAGAMTPAGDGVLIPAVGVPTEAAPAAWHEWLALGYTPLRLKYCSHAARRRRTLAGVLTTLEELPELGCVPQRLSGRWLVSLHLPGASDLRESMTYGGYEGAARVHEYCLRSLMRFAGADATIRDSIRDNGLPPPSAFPVLTRYRRAVACLKRLLGPVDLPATLLPSALTGTAILFCDPKPANFLVPPPTAGRATAVPRDHEYPRVDLELMCYECPLSLQLVLTLFAHPISFHRPGRLDEQFAGLRAYAHEAAARFEVSPEEVDVMLAYHLVRNFASSVAASGPGARVKALSFGVLLACALGQIPVLGPAPRTGQRLRQWIGESRREPSG